MILNFIFGFLTIIITCFLGQYTHFESKCYVFESRYDLYINLLKMLEKFYNITNSLLSRFEEMKRITFKEKAYEFQYGEENHEYADSLALLWEEINGACNKAKLIFPECKKGIDEIEQHTGVVIDYLCGPDKPGDVRIFGNIIFDELSPSKEIFEKSQEIIYNYSYNQRNLSKLLEPHISLPVMQTTQLWNKIKSIL